MGRPATSRSTGPTGGTATSTLVRHYNDTSDNPAWVETTGTNTGVTRYGESLGGDLGVTIDGAGNAQLTLTTLHGDIVTTVDIPATGAATSSGAWSDYDEYGNPRTLTATAAVGGATGYGWLGARQRATDDTGLMLMGARLYNRVTGLFTSVDPVPGGNTTAYGYPQDPINAFDLDGRWSHRWSRFFKGVAIGAAIVGFGACVLASAGICGAVGVAGLVASGVSRGYDTFRSRRDLTWGNFGRFALATAQDYAWNKVGGRGMKAAMTRHEWWLMGGGRAAWRKGMSFATAAAHSSSRSWRRGVRVVENYRFARVGLSTGGQFLL